MEIFPPTDGPVPEIDPSKPHSARIYDDVSFPVPAEVSCYGGVARKR